MADSGDGDGSTSTSHAVRRSERNGGGQENEAFLRHSQANDDFLVHENTGKDVVHTAAPAVGRTTSVPAAAAKHADSAVQASPAAPSTTTTHQPPVQCTETTEIEELVEEIQELHPRRSRDLDASEDAASATGQQNNIFIDDDQSTTVMKHSIIIICDVSKLLTPVGLVKIAIVVSCVISLACICATDYPALVLSGYARFHIFSLTFTFLTVLVVFLLEVLTLLLLFPVHWARWNAFIHLAVCLLLAGSSSLLVHALIMNESVMPRFDITVELIVISVLSGYFVTVLCLLISLMACFCYDHHMALPWNQHPEGVLMLK